MPVTWTFGKKIAAGFTCSALALLVVAIVGYQSTHHLIANDELVSHTHQVRRDIAELISLLKDAETGQRGFVITGDESYLEPYLSARAAIDKMFDEVRRLTADDVHQQQRLDAARPLIDAKLAELAKTIEQRRTEGFEPTAKFIELNLGKKVMDQLRQILGEMDEAERLLLEQRREGAEASAQLAKAVMIWGSAIGIALVALLGFLITRSLSKQIGTAVEPCAELLRRAAGGSQPAGSGSKEQATAMSEITTTISELLATSRQIAESAQRVARSPSGGVRGARGGRHGGGRGTSGADHPAPRRDQIVGHMLELGKKSQQIGSVLDIVSELAEQTNILAINATIEAAGAGDAGKRFAVVADEIRKLADRVGGSTKEIRTLIDDVRSAVNTTVMATETGSKAVDAGARQFADVAGFQQIARTGDHHHRGGEGDRLSTKQQSTAGGAGQPGDQQRRPDHAETETSASQTLQTASELAGLSTELLRLVQPQAAA